jgi:hypothetical protein
LKVKKTKYRYFSFIASICLVGYAMLGRGFAYTGVPPIFIGEVFLILGIFTLYSTFNNNIFKSHIVWLLIAYMTTGLFTTFPHITNYGLDSLRDAVTWGYGMFAIIILSILLKTQNITLVTRKYARWLPFFLLAIPIMITIYRYAFNYIPRHPISGIPMINPKIGDIAVHLAGAFTFIILGLRRISAKFGRSIQYHSDLLLWLFWSIAIIFVFVSRAAIITVLVGVFITILLKPINRWTNFIIVGVLCLLVFFMLDININLGINRSISADDIVLTIQSIYRDTDIPYYDGPKQWRLSWWYDIMEYTFYGEYFWSGKGYGINLADDDGYQVNVDPPLRNPHNIHLTILARSGVPGFITWIILQISFVYGLLKAFFNARRKKQAIIANLNVWIIAYWAAFMMNGTFDVFLEGPQGGIWFWCVFGFGIAFMEMQKRGLVHTHNYVYQK